MPISSLLFLGWSDVPSSIFTLCVLSCRLESCFRLFLFFVHVFSKNFPNRRCEGNPTHWIFDSYSRIEFQLMLFSLYVNPGPRSAGPWVGCLLPTPSADLSIAEHSFSYLTRMVTTFDGFHIFMISMCVISWTYAGQQLSRWKKGLSDFMSWLSCWACCSILDLLDVVVRPKLRIDIHVLWLFIF